MIGRPPDLRRQVVARLTQRFHRLREQDRLCDGHRLGRETLLGCLIAEGGEVGRNHHAGDDIDIGLFEGVDLRREVIRQVLVPARIHSLVAGGGKARRHADIRITPGIAIGIVGEQSPDLLVGVELIPHVGEHGDDVFKAPEIMIGEIKRLPAAGVARVSLLADEPWLPGRFGGNCRHAFAFADGGNRVGGFRRRGDQHQIDAVVDDQFLRHIGGAVGVGLAVLDDDFDIHPLFGGIFVEHGDGEGIGFGKTCKRTGLRTDIADADFPALRDGGHRQPASSDDEAAGGGSLDNASA